MISLPPKMLTIDMIRSLVSDTEVLKSYTDISRIPCKINSPFRTTDKNASFCWYYMDGRLFFKDFGDESRGDVYEFLKRLWNTDMRSVVSRVYRDLSLDISKVQTSSRNTCQRQQSATIRIMARDFEKRDEEFWGRFGIDIPTLKRFDVMPIEYFWVNYGKSSSLIKADRIAYAYMENKDGSVTFKIYQPFSKTKKWTSSMDRSTLGLWNGLPKDGDIVCVCSSVKDALCLYSVCGIPSISLPGEGMPMSDSAISSLKSRFRRCCILLDSDLPGRTYSSKLKSKTGFDEIVLPITKDYKDIAECYEFLGRTEFVLLINRLFDEE